MLPSANWFYLSILLLASAKLLAIFHIPLNEYYLDIDRMIALILFLALYHAVYSNNFSVKPYIVLCLYGVSIAILGALIGLNGYKLLILFFMTALVEEILLRGVLFEWLLQKMSPMTVLFGSTMFFTAAHPAIYQSGLYAIAVFLSGLLLGWVYLHYRTASREMALVYATGVHGLIILAGLKSGLI